MADTQTQPDYPVMSDEDVGLGKPANDQGLPQEPQVPNGVPYPTYSDDQVGIVGKKSPSLLRQIIDPSTAIDNLLPSGNIYQSVANVAHAFGEVAHAFGESVAQSGEDINKDIYSQGGGDLVEYLKSNGMFQPYVEDQNDFNKGYFYKTAYPAIYNMVSKAGENVTRGLAATGNIPKGIFDVLGTTVGQGVQEATGLDPEEQMGIAQTLETNIPGIGHVIGGVLEYAASRAGRFGRVPRSVAEGEASGIVGTTEGQNAGTEPLTENQHVQQAVAESEVRPIQANSSVSEIPQDVTDHIAFEPKEGEHFEVGSDGEGGYIASKKDGSFLREDGTWSQRGTPISYDTHEEAANSAAQMIKGDSEKIIRDKYEKLADEGKITIDQFNDILKKLSGEVETTTPENNIHGYARALDPETFGKYDQLSATRDDLRKQMSDMDDLSKQKILDQDERDTRYNLQQQLQETNAGMRELAPKVSEAYLQAQQFEKQPESVMAGEHAIEPLEEQKAALVEPDKASPITHDIEQKLIAVGRNSDEAKASAEVATRMYQYLADVYGGAKGTAQDWYVREGADIKGAKERAKVLAQPSERGAELKQARTVSDLNNSLQREHGVKANVIQTGNGLHLAKIEVPKSERGQGTGKKAMQDIIDYADQSGQKITLTPTKEFGATSVGRLKNFYKKFGFVENKGKNKDFSISDSMYRTSEPISTELEQTAKGKIRLATDDASAVISLMKSADASTFVHESAHHFLDMMDRFSKEADVPEKLKADMDAIRKWTGLSEKPYETAKEKRAYTQAHEKFARGFERYLMEGVAPNRDMALVFAKFKQWMTSIYKTVLGIPNQRGAINEDVRGFFDRVMSTTPERTVIAPNHPAEIGLKDNINSPRLGDLFGTVPKAPQTLTEWLASKGGVGDKSGDLSAMDADKAHIDLKTGKVKPFVGKLVKDGGMSLEDAARAAQEAGYFPEKGGERPTIEEIKSKIMEDLSGNKQYSDKDHEALNNHEESLKYNAQIDKISHETGINHDGKTHDEFFDEVNKYYDAEKRYNEAQHMAEETAKDYENYQDKEREFIESRGEAWEPPKEPETATFEDLENERKQEQIANDAASGAGNTQESQRPAGVSEPSEAGVRQSGNSIESDGREGQGGIETEAAELAARQRLSVARTNIADAPIGDTDGAEPRSATRPNEPNTKSEFYDKAGNVRLDLLTDSNSIKSAMREAADKSPQIFNHGVITDAQVAEFADAMGVDAKNLNIQKLRQISVDDDIPLAARIRSGSQMMVDALNHSLELMNKENPSDEDVTKFLEAKNQFLMIAETVSATTNEMGRGFRAYNNLMKEYNVTDIHEAAELFQRMTGRNLDQVKAEMKVGSLLKTPKQVAKFTQDSLKPDFFDKLIEYRNNSLLSGPVTHTFYTAGGFLNAAYKPLQTLFGVAVQAIREAIGDEITQRQYAHEALAQFQALGYGSMRGLKVAAESWKRGEEVALPSEIKSAPLLAPIEHAGLEGVEGTGGMGWLPSHQAIDGKLGAIINVPSRVIRSIHSFLKVLNYQQNSVGLAVREALDNGLKPGTDEYNKFVSDTIESPSSKMMEQAGRDSLKEVYRERVNWNSTPGKLFNIVNSNPVTKVLFPFIKMQYNIKRLAFRDNSVLGFFAPEIRADISGINGDVAKNMAIGRISAGTAVAGLGISMTMQGLNNGGGPSDPKAYKTWRLTHTPYAVQVGSLVIPHKSLGTLGQLLGWSADMAEGAHEFNADDIEKSAWQFVRKSSAVFTEEGFLTQAKNTLDAAFTPQQFGTRFIQNFATQWLPFSTGFSQSNRLLNDPYARRVKSLGAENLWGVPESMAYKYPGTSELLQPMRDMFGQPVTFSSSYDRYANDPVVQKLESLQTGIGRLSDKIKGVQLTEQQYDDYSRIAGQMTYARLSKIIAMPGFGKMPPQHQMQMIERTTSQCRLLAANTIMKTNPDIIRQAIAKKRMSIYGNKAVTDAEQPQTEDINNP